MVAHGSRSEKSNQHFADLVGEISTDQPEGTPLVQHAFLEMAEPDIAQGLTRLKQSGAKTILLLPYFLSPGRHVAEDIPSIAQKWADENSDIEVKALPYLGSQRHAMLAIIHQLIDTQT